MRSTDLPQPDVSSPDPSNPWGLTDCERQLLELRAQGLTYEKAAKKLNYSPPHMKRVGSDLMVKLRANGTIDPGVNDIFGVVELFQLYYCDDNA